MKKTIYIVATDLPSLKGGAQVRNLNLIKQYLKHDFNVSVFCLYDSNLEVELERLKRIPKLKVHAFTLPKLTPVMTMSAILLHRVLPYMRQYRVSQLTTAVKKACDEQMPDIIQVEEITAYYAVVPWLGKLGDHPLVVLDAHNVENVTLARAFRTFSGLRKLAGQFILPNITKFENAVARNVDAVLACSAEDAQYFQRYANKVMITPNGADCAYFAEQPEGPPESLLFMGGTSYPPNDEALRWYFSAIHPLVKSLKPLVQISILGGTPPEWLCRLAATDNTIALPGLVDDVRDYLARASICISPMLGGSGTSLKILEYMACAKAVVSTTVGARGIDYTDGQNILIADDAETFARDIVALMDRPERSTLLAHNARRLMEDVYDWDVIGKNLVANFGI